MQRQARMNANDPLTERIIGCAIELHRFLGPGLLERIYKTGMAIELEHHRIPFELERHISVTYRGSRLGDYYADLIVANEVIVEVKCVARHDPVFEAQILSYMRLTGLRKGLLLNFGRPVLKDGIQRFAL
jgi:GxxExxY protein